MSDPRVEAALDAYEAYLAPLSLQQSQHPTHHRAAVAAALRAADEAGWQPIETADSVEAIARVLCVLNGNDPDIKYPMNEHGASVMVVGWKIYEGEAQETVDGLLSAGYVLGRRPLPPGPQEGRKP